MIVTVVPGGTLAGTGTVYGSVTLVTALVNVVSNVPLMPGPATLTRTSSSPRLSVATTLNATTESDDAAAAVTWTTGGVVSAMTPPPAPFPSTQAAANTIAARANTPPVSRPARTGVPARAGLTVRARRARVRVIGRSRSAVAAGRTDGVTVVDNVWGDEDQEIRLVFLGPRLAEQLADEREIDQERNAGLGLLDLRGR